MSLALFGNIFEPVEKGEGQMKYTVPQIQDKDKVKALLSRELGYIAQEKYNLAAINAMAHPDTQLEKYYKALEEDTKTAADVYIKDVNTLIDIGYPTERAHDIALTTANDVMNGRKKLLAARFPLVGDLDLLASAAAKAGTKVHVPAVFGQPSSAVVPAKYEKYRAAYKAGRPSKRGGK
jgi:hypothetical protein